MNLVTSLWIQMCLFMLTIVETRKNKIKLKCFYSNCGKSNQGALAFRFYKEFYVTTTRKLAHPLMPEKASQIISDLGLWRVHQPQVEDIISAVQIQQRHQLSFWDSMIVRSANQLGCDVIWTEDLNEGQVVEGCSVKSPFFLKVLSLFFNLFCASTSDLKMVEVAGDVGVGENCAGFLAD